MLAQKDFKTIIDVVTRFPTEKSCHEYLASRRWSDGIMLCPHEGCGNDTAYVYKDGIRYKCKCCQRIYTAKTGTFMEASKLPTIKWFISIYLFLHKKGISSIQLSKDIGVQQKTAWFILCRLRLALGNESTEQLEGVVEIDETFVGGAAKFKHRNKRPKYLKEQGRDLPDKTPVMGFLQRGVKVRALVIANTTSRVLYHAVRANIKEKATVMTDGYRGYMGFDWLYDCKSIDHGKGFYGDGDIHTNTIEGFWSQFKKGIKGIYHKTTPKHLQGYVNEFVFRYNYRTLDAQQQIDCIISKMEVRLKYKDLVA